MELRSEGERGACTFAGRFGVRFAFKILDSICDCLGAVALRAGSFVALPPDLLFTAGLVDFPAAALPLPCPVLAAGTGFARLGELFCLLVPVRVRAEVLCLRSGELLLCGAFCPDFFFGLAFVTIASDPSRRAANGNKNLRLRSLEDKCAASPINNPGKPKAQTGPHFPPRPSYAGVSVPVNTTVTTGITQSRVGRR